MNAFVSFVLILPYFDAIRGIQLPATMIYEIKQGVAIHSCRTYGTIIFVTVMPTYRLKGINRLTAIRFWREPKNSRKTQESPPW